MVRFVALQRARMNIYRGDWPLHTLPCSPIRRVCVHRCVCVHAPTRTRVGLCGAPLQVWAHLARALC
jgi:hypothetical protein